MIIDYEMTRRALIAGSAAAVSVAVLMPPAAGAAPRVRDVVSQRMSSAIMAHRVAVADDELMANTPIGVETAIAERGSFNALLTLGCAGHADVQAKVAYLLNGTQGDRYSLLRCLISGTYADEAAGLDIDADERLGQLLRSITVIA